MKVYVLNCYDVNDSIDWIIGVYSDRNRANREKEMQIKKAATEDEWRTFRVEEWEVID